MKTAKTVAITLLAAYGAAACTSIRPVLVPAEFIPKEQPELIWVVDGDEEAIPVSGPSLQADSIVGSIGSSTVRFAVPLTQARLVLAKQPDRRRTTFLVAGLGAFAGLAVWRFATAGEGEGLPCTFPSDKDKRCP